MSSLSKLSVNRPRSAADVRLPLPALDHDSLQPAPKGKRPPRTDTVDGRRYHDVISGRELKKRAKVPKSNLTREGRRRRKDYRESQRPL